MSGRCEDEKEHVDEQLDEALDDTFPASDPVQSDPRAEPDAHDGPCAEEEPQRRKGETEDGADDPDRG